MKLLSNSKAGAHFESMRAIRAKSLWLGYALLTLSVKG